MTRLASILLGLFLVTYALSAFGLPLGLVVPILALATGIVVLINSLPPHPRQQL